MVAVVVDEERRAARALVERRDLDRTAEREGVSLLEVVGLFRRCAGERVRRGVERRARERRRELAADLLVAHAAAESESARPTEAPLAAESAATKSAAAEPSTEAATSSGAALSGACVRAEGVASRREVSR